MLQLQPSVIVFIGAVISVVGALLSGVGVLRSSQQQTRRQVELREKADEIAELNRHIANAQIELRKRSDEVAELNRTIAASVTGGDSYCYLTLSHRGPNNAIILIVHQGNYPLYDVSIRMVDLDKSEEVRRKFPTPTFESLKLSETIIPVGNLSPGLAARSMHSIQTSTADKFRYNIFISARNGVFTELLRFAKVEGVWKSAMKVEKNNYSGTNPNAPPTVLKEEVDPDYPRDKNGQVQWK